MQDNAQQDAHEFLSSLMTTLHEETLPMCPELADRYGTWQVRPGRLIKLTTY
jgi:hypothetical protein